MTILIQNCHFTRIFMNIVHSSLNISVKSNSAIFFFFILIIRIYAEICFHISELSRSVELWKLRSSRFGLAILLIYGAHQGLCTKYLPTGLFAFILRHVLSTAETASVLCSVMWLDIERQLMLFSILCIAIS